jgi:hypothetical protein
MQPADGDIEVGGLLEQVSDMTRKMVEAYQRSPVLRILVKLNPALAAAEAGILGTYSYFMHQRLMSFAAEFTTLGINVSEADATSKEFFDAYASTARRVLSESRESKIRLFAHLFAEFLRGERLTSIDLYEEHLSILEDLSEREFRLLLLLRRHEAGCPPREGENILQRANRFWPEFAREATEKLNIPAGHLEPMLDRLSRTGLYQTCVGGFWDYTGGRGYITANFDHFCSALGIRDSEAHS